MDREPATEDSLLRSKAFMAQESFSLKILRLSNEVYPEIVIAKGHI